MSNTPPPPPPPTPTPNFHARDLSLTLAGIFQEGGGTTGPREEETHVEISSENSAPGKSRSDYDDFELAEAEDHNNIDADEDEDEDDGDNKIKKRKKYHRHTPEQIKEMEALFKDSPHPDEKQRLQLSKQLGLHPKQVKFWFQNRRTQIKVEKLRSIIAKNSSQNSSSYTSGNNQENKSSFDCYTGIFALEKSRIMDAVNKAMDELRKMATFEKPLWIRSYETGREILNYDEYLKEFRKENSDTMQPNKSIEVSREKGVVFVELSWLVQSFMDVNQWKELFPCLISKAATIDVVSDGEGADKLDGAVQLMFVEVQLLTPMVAAREVYFVRYCKKLCPNQWAIVDVSIDKVEDNIDASMQKCRKRPSGCIIEDKFNGHCEVTWVEHLESQKSSVHSMYRTIVNNGLAFGAKHWVSTLQQQCERLAFFVATNVPTKNSSGVDTLAGRKSLLTLAQRMNRSFCRALGASSYNSWNKLGNRTGIDIRLSSRKNLNDTGEPLGTILSAASSVWLSVSHNVLFDFLRDENRRNQWDIMSNETPVQIIAHLAKGKARGNAVTVLSIETEEKNMWILQDSSTNDYESMVVYAPVDINGLQSVMAGCDSSNTAILSSGFSILPDGIKSRPLVITSREDENGTEGGSLLTIVFQILMSNSPTAKLSMESVDTVNTLVSCTLQNIKKSLLCED
ncbi:hypothetical protein RD792_015138 [Penstemon davidsonii]|uniref:Uncharacterized protein n=1 Tax=Penstemon davidsonii TaxID=160366 RepID=A0ABR0CRV6_9LAMI|nr:hypothetical protein RD792_015138 [Penstemon davidsonii]